MAGVEISSQSQATYKAYVRKADILEAAHKIFEDALDNSHVAGSAEPVFNYLEARGYSLDDILSMELGAYTDRLALQSSLQKQGYTGKEIKDSGLLTQGFGEDYQLTLLWRDQAGRAIGIVARPILPEDQIKQRDLSKYKYSAGLEKDQGLIGFSACRGSYQVILVEGVLDALYLNTKGFMSVAVGGTSLSAAQIQALETAGTKELLLAMDMDEAGQKATERIIKSLSTSGLRPYVVSLPEGYKDPDELVRKAGADLFQEALEKAESWPKWLARRVVSKHDLTTDRGLDQALEAAIEIHSGLSDKIELRAFTDSLKQSTGLSEEELASRLQKVSEKASASRSQAILEENIRNIQQKASQGDITGAQIELTKALRDISSSRGVEAPEPYLVEDLIQDTLATSPAMATGYKRLDEEARIPVGALTIIAGRPGHGKTTLQLNLLLNMLKAYPGKKFYFFSYEEARKAIATKIIMILAGVDLGGAQNYGAYVNYLQEKRGSNPKVDKAIKEYEQLTSSGRLLISDKPYPAEDLASVISLLAKSGETGAVIVDYIQKIPLLKPSQAQRYLDIKQVSSLLLQQAVSLDIPIILGAQLGRGQGSDSRVRLDNLRESGDIEQDANLVLGLYTEAVDKIENDPLQGATKAAPEVDIQISVLKNRAGVAGRVYTMTINRPVYKITDKSSGSSSSSSGNNKTY